VSLFQHPARTPEEIAGGQPLGISPTEVAELDEETWYARAYRGDGMPQLTVRAVLMGMLLGFFLAFTNLYIGLKTGWHLGVAITACILSFALWQALLAARIARTPMSILENNCMQSSASAAGYATGSTLVSAIPALLMLSVTQESPGGVHLPFMVLLGWVFLLAMLGTCMAIPMKRTMINRERLRFPSGTAAAVTLQSLYADSAAALRKAKALLWSGLIAATIPPLTSLNVLATKHADGSRSLLPEHYDVFDKWLPVRGTVPKTGEAAKAADWGIQLSADVALCGAGMIMGFRITFWMLAGAIVLAFGAGPWGLEQLWTNPDDEIVRAVTTPSRAWREIGLWFGAPFLIGAALTAFALQGKAIVRAFRRVEGGADRSSIEVPNSWFYAGSMVAAIGLVVLAEAYFSIPFYFGALAVLLAFLLCLVAARITGETDVTPTGAMGKIVQLTYAGLMPQQPTPNLMTAGITSGSATACADLLNDLRSGYLLGANPRRQFVAQFLGIFSGSLATVIGFRVLVTDASKLPIHGVENPEFAAPAAVQWKAVADLLTKGLDNFHPAHQNAIMLGLVLGAALTLVEKLSRKEWRRWLPSPTGFGLGFILPFANNLQFFLGGLAILIWGKVARKNEEAYGIPVASGIIAGAAILGVIVACLNNFVFKWE
jgi:uncharacterized oligopeptide transporter (OPT) family protein